MLNRSIIAVKLALALGALLAVSTAQISATASTSQPSKPLGQLIADGELKELRISAIPDSDAKKIEDKCGLVCDLLSKTLGIPVKFMPQQNYAACVTALATDQLELVWFGGVTGVQADKKMGDKCTFIACRDIDKKFKSYFIASKESKIGECKDLKELAEKCEGKTFTFGSKGSTSGHVMPRFFFQDQTGLKVEDVFKNVAYSGSHDKTLRDVADGSAFVGAMNYKNWDTAKDDNLKAKEKCEIVYTTPDYVDYMWVARTAIGEKHIKAIKEAFLGLDSKNETDAKILESWGTKGGKFIECEKSEWEKMAKILDSGIDVG